MHMYCHACIQCPSFHNLQSQSFLYFKPSGQLTRTHPGSNQPTDVGHVCHQVGPHTVTYLTHSRIVNNPRVGASSNDDHSGLEILRLRCQPVVVYASSAFLYVCMCIPYCHTTILSCCHTVILPYCHTAILPYCHTAILPYCHTAILPYCHTAILPYCHTAILPYRHTAILSYGHTAILPYHHTAILPYCHAVIPPYCHTLTSTW